MNRILFGSVVVGALLAGAGWAAPTEEQIDAAVQDASRVDAVLDAAATHEDRAAALGAVVDRIDKSGRSDKEKLEAIAQLTAHAVVHLDAQAAAVIGRLAGRVDARWLPGITASAVVSGGPRSPEIYQAIRQTAGTTDDLQKTIEQAGRNPASVLGILVLTRLPVLPPLTGRQGQPQIIEGRDITLLPPQGWREGGPRPPARRYRGQ